MISMINIMYKLYIMLYTIYNYTGPNSIYERHLYIKDIQNQSSHPTLPPIGSVAEPLALHKNI